MPDYSLTTATMRGMQFGRGTSWRINPENGVVNWLSLPGYSLDSQPRFGDHGDANAAVHFTGRDVIVNGFVRDATNRDQLVAEFLETMSPGLNATDEEELSITMGGQTLSVLGKIVARDITLVRGWGNGSFGWKFQVDCSSPYRLGPPERAVFVLGQEGAGLVPPFTPPITFPAGTGNGAGVVVNSGNAPAHTVFEMVGEQTAPGVANTSTGRVVRLSGQQMVAGDVLTIDTDSSQINYNGEARRADSASDLLIDMRLQPGPNAINALSQPGATPATLSVVFRATYW